MDIQNLNIKKFNHQIYQLIENNNLEDINKYIPILNTIISSYNKDKERRGAISLLFKYYIMTNDNSIETFYTLNKKFLMKRDILNFINYIYYINKDSAIDNFKYLLNNYEIDFKNIEFLINNKLNELLVYLEGIYVNVTSPITLKDLKYENDQNILSKHLKKFSFDSDVVNKILSMIKNDITRYKYINSLNFNKDNNYIIIDAGNILHSIGGKVTKSGYILLLELVDKLLENNYHPIVVIHERHIKKKSNENKYSDILKRNKNIFLIKTPYKENDDLYIIFLGLKFQIKIITNDNFLDHIFKYNLNEITGNKLTHYINELVTKYNMLNKKLIIENYNYSYSNCIQFVNEDLYFYIYDEFTIYSNNFS